MPIFPGGYQQQAFHSCIIGLIEFAETCKEDCDSLIIILEKCTKNIDNLLRTLLYFGFQLIDPRIYNQSTSYVLVGYEL
ncbi:hypothetical protein LRAMOSA10696 [Lichtheimia ramosa]|uniref:Uncharacterized protein n=1 Tax=Lichtheimia ramosa TaxID=688394 RepID=A0A077WP06_9FUNG|nr:hypothetical protein LRAMOSA10696 [Lichtheimia ramosa]